MFYERESPYLITTVLKNTSNFLKSQMNTKKKKKKVSFIILIFRGLLEIYNSIFIQKCIILYSIRLRIINRITRTFNTLYEKKKDYFLANQKLYFNTIKIYST